MSFIDTADGTRLHYLDWGSGPPLVLIHGWPVQSMMWESQLTALPPLGIRCIAYDRRGFGKSSKPWEGYDYTTLAADLDALMTALDLRDVTLAGFSMGGGEAVRYFSKFGGSRVAKVALISAVPPFMLKTGDNPGGVDQSVFNQMLDGIREDRPKFFTEFAKTFFGVGLISSPVSAAMLEWFRAMALEASPRATLECVKSFSATDFRGGMSSIAVPALVIHGDNDQTVPFEISGKESARLIPQAALKVYEGAPHGLYYTHREGLNRDLAEFVLGNRRA